MIRYIAAFCGLLALQLLVEKKSVGCNSAIILGYVLGFIVGCFK